MYFKTTQEHEKLRADIREWAEREIKPYGPPPATLRCPLAITTA